jgi:N-acetylmuramoyl-L-alanine amidase
VTPRHLQIRAVLLALATLTLRAQPPAHTPTKKPRPGPVTSTVNPNVIFLDPAHGGSDNGAKLSDDTLEKDANLAFAARLRIALTADGFVLIQTRDNSADQPTGTQRAEQANRSHAAACLFLHTSNAGHGVHLFLSSLPSSPLANPMDDPLLVLPWDAAQAYVAPQSQRLSVALADSFRANRLPFFLSHTSVPPIDSTTCPAIAIEIAPLDNNNNADTPADDPAYQQRVSLAIATALATWRARLNLDTSLTAPPQYTARPTPKPTAKPDLNPGPSLIDKPAPIPKPRSIPIETPDIVTTPPVATPDPRVPPQ